MNTKVIDTLYFVLDIPFILIYLIAPYVAIPHLQLNCVLTKYKMEFQVNESSRFTACWISIVSQHWTIPSNVFTLVYAT